MNENKNPSSDILSTIAQTISSVLTTPPFPSAQEKEIEETPQRLKTRLRVAKKPSLTPRGESP